MFTVKIISPYGNEDIYDARDFHAKAGEPLTSDVPPPYERVSFQTSDGTEIEFEGDGATIYVMNSNGKTVSRYFLGEELAPVSSD